MTFHRRCLAFFVLGFKNGRVKGLLFPFVPTRNKNSSKSKTEAWLLVTRHIKRRLYFTPLEQKLPLLAI